MNRSIVVLAVVTSLLLPAVAWAADTDVMISEIMYNPGEIPDTTSTEWIELYNAGTTTVDIGSWTLTQAVSGFAITIPALEMLGPGETYLISDIDAEGPTTFLAAWGTDSDTKVPSIIAWGGPGFTLENPPTPAGPTTALILADELSTVVDTVDYLSFTAAPTLIADPGGPSIYVLPEFLFVGSDNSVEGAWGISTVGTHGAIAAVGAPWDSDVGSPGKVVVVPEPSSMALVGLAALGMAWRRRRRKNGASAEDAE